MRRLFFLPMILLPLAAHALPVSDVPVDELRIQAGLLEFRVGAKWNAACAVKNFAPGTPLVHWGPEHETARWLKQGFVGADELANWVKNGGGATGGGFYVSLSGADSADYGPTAVVATLQMPMLTYFTPYQQKPTCPNVSSQNGKLKFSYNYGSPMPPEFSDPAMPSSQVVFPYIDGGMLKGVGIQAIQFSESWINVIAPEPLGSLRRMTPDLFLNFVYPAFPRLRDLIEFDEFFGLDGNPLLAKASAILDLISRDQPVSVSELEKLNADLFHPPPPGLSVGTTSPIFFLSSQWTSLKSKVLKRLKPFLVRDLKDIFKGQIALGGQFAMDPVFNTISNTLPYGVLLEELLPFHRSSTRGIPKPFDRDHYNSLPELGDLPGWARNFESWAKYGHPYQVLLAAAEGDGSPWYRDPLPGSAKSWEELARMPWTTSPDSSASSFEQQYFNTYGNLPVFREMPESIEKLPVDSHQLNALQDNPYLLISGIAPSPTPDRFWVRVEFPYVSHWKNQRQFLTPELIAKFEAAEVSGALLDPASFEARLLNQEFLKFLLRRYDAGDYGNAIPELRISHISPFGREVGQRIVRRNTSTSTLDSILKLRPTEFLELRNMDSERRRMITRGLQVEYDRNPTFPKFFDVPALWRAGLEVYGSLADEEELVVRGKKFFLNPEISALVKAREYEEVRARIWAEFPTEKP